MKKTIYITMLAAALLGGQVFAEVTGTAVEGCEQTSGNQYCGRNSETDSVTGGNVTIKADNKGEVPNNAQVYGGRSNAKGGNASSNTVVMSGGKVALVCSGFTAGEANAVNNVAIVTGGTITGTLYAAFDNKGTAMNNKIHLVGKGASNVSIADAQGIISTYTGGTAGISLGDVAVASVGSSGTSENNSIDIYGTGITVARKLAGMQTLTFDITDGQMTGQSPEAALTLTSTDEIRALNLKDVELQVKDLDVQSWTPGTSITLVQAAQAIQVGDDWGKGKAVDIMKNGQVVALGQLVLSNDNKTLSLTVQGSVPEPSTGTLTMLALAALAARRRRK